MNAAQRIVLIVGCLAAWILFGASFDFLGPDRPALRYVALAVLAAVPLVLVLLQVWRRRAAWWNAMRRRVARRARHAPR